MNHHPVLLKSSLLLALIAGLLAGACDKPGGGGDDFRKDCGSVGTMLFTCEGFATPEGSEYTLNCMERGKEVAKADKACGELWGEAYSCAAALPCEEFNEWKYARTTTDPEKEFPCKEERDAFYAECGDLPLWAAKK